VQLSSRLITAQLPSDEVIQKGKLLITKLATEKDLNEAM
jgi:hypothetical protein